MNMAGAMRTDSKPSEEMSDRQRLLEIADVFDELLKIELNPEDQRDLKLTLAALRSYADKSSH